jgi:hypothetical protein
VGRWENPPQTLNFGEALLGTKAGVQTVRLGLQNDAHGGMPPIQIAIAGDSDASFAETHYCETPLITMSQCTIVIAFTPQTTGLHAASLVITSPSMETVVYPLEGTGTAIEASSGNSPGSASQSPSPGPQLTSPGTNSSAYSLWFSFLGILVLVAVALIVAKWFFRSLDGSQNATRKSTSSSQPDAPSSGRTTTSDSSTSGSQDIEAQFRKVINCVKPVIGEEAVKDLRYTGIEASALLFGDILFIVKSMAMSDTGVTVGDAELTLRMGKLVWPEQIRSVSINPEVFHYCSEMINKYNPPENTSFACIRLLRGYDRTHGTKFTEDLADLHRLLLFELINLHDSTSSAIAAAELNSLLDDLISGEQPSSDGDEAEDASVASSGCEQCRNSYDILRVEEGAEQDEVKAAWRDLVQFLHPDRLGDKSQRVRQRAEDDLKKVNVAYEHLCKCPHRTVFFEKHPSGG